MKKLLIPAALAAALSVVACSAGEQTPPPSVAASVGAQDLLARHGMQGATAREIVDTLEATQDDRRDGPVGSVLPDAVVISDDAGQVSLPLGEEFYLSVAPFVTQTHDCHHHNLAGCQGELVGQEFEVSIVADDGETLFEGTKATHDNGFMGFWLPRDIRATLTVTGDGKTSSMAIGTGQDDPTCLTTMQLA